MILDLDALWTPTGKNRIIRNSHATNRLRVGGTGSSKSSDALMEIFTNYLMRWDGCHALWMRRKWGDLEKSTFLDFKQFLPEGIYDWNNNTHILTIKPTGSKLFFGVNEHDNESKMLEAYLSAAFPVINLDECAQFSGDTWEFLRSRNRVNRECKADADGQFPRPVMLGETNPVGPHWGFYRSQFVLKKPWNKPEGSRKDDNGLYWTKDAQGKYLLDYNPGEWDYVHSTLLDNPYLMERDPDLIRKLESLPEAKRQKFLYGDMDAISGQYFDCFDEGINVVNLTDDPTAIIWQPWQPRWVGWDFGRAHWTAMYWFTIALVKIAGGEYRQKTVIYREHVDRGKGYEDLCEILFRQNSAGLPGQEGTTGLRTIYFSHEKFNQKFDEAQAPSHVVSRFLSARGLPAVQRFNAGPGTRIPKATLMYDMLKTGNLAVLHTCRNLIESIPMLIRDEKNIEDVLKMDTKADDCYDACSSGLYSWYGTAAKPEEEVLRDRLKAIEDPMTRHLAQLKATSIREKKQGNVEDNRPQWYHV